MRYIARIKTIDPETASSVFREAWEAGDHEMEVDQNSIEDIPGAKHGIWFTVSGKQFPNGQRSKWTFCIKDCPHLGGGDCVLELVPDDYIINQ